MNAINYKALLNPENYEDLRQAAIDLKIREMMNVGCAWHIVWTGLADTPFPFDPGDPHHVALLEQSAARECEGQTVRDVLNEIAKLVFEWVTPGFNRESGDTLEGLVANVGDGRLVRVNKQRDALPSAARYVYHPAAFRLPCRDVGVSRVQMPRGGDV